MTINNESEETERQSIISEIGNMHWHGWVPWPAHIPDQAGYEYSNWVGYDLQPLRYSRPGCSIWLRIKWLFLRKPQPSTKTDGTKCSCPPNR